MVLTKLVTSDAIRFVLIDEKRRDEEYCQDLQTKEGFNPAGYGFACFAVILVSGEYVHTWFCYKSCD